MSTPADVTLVKGAIHNPADPRHFMRITPASQHRLVRLDTATLANSTEAVVVKEVGRDIYDPVVYFPRSDVEMDSLEQSEKSTHCPLKGNTAYFDAIVDGVRYTDVAWSYVDTIDEANELHDLIAFDPSQTTLT